MTIGEMISAVESWRQAGEEGGISQTKAEEIAIAIIFEYLDEGDRKEELAFEMGWKYGHGYIDMLKMIDDYLYYKFGYDIEDALDDMRLDEEMEKEENK